MQANLGRVYGSISGSVTSGTLAAFASNFWNPGWDVCGQAGSQAADFFPSTVSINGVPCLYQQVTVTNRIYSQVTETWNYAANLGRVYGSITGTVNSGTLAAYASNFWNAGANLVGQAGSQPGDFSPTTVSINGVVCQYEQGGSATAVTKLTPNPPVTPPATPAVQGPSCIYSVGLGGHTWLTPGPSTGTPTNNINLYLHASGATSIPSPYTVTIYNPIYSQVTSVWNYQASLGQVSGTVTGRVISGTLAAFATNFWNPGLNVLGKAGSQPGDFFPTSVSINGVLCQYQPGPVPVTAPSKPAAPALLAPVSPAAAGAPCAYSVGSGGHTWLTPGPSTGTPTNNINLYLHASGSQSIPSPYTVTIYNPIYSQVTSVWNYQAKTGAIQGTVTGTVTSGTLAAFANNFFNPGYNAVGQPGSQPADFVPRTVSINGVQCQWRQNG
ncbi:hypothetical protein WJX73_004718 [Symbiochloris irregularis]|uniref:Uncharacterized protein n=1 Tax=Symbiochloris irregularis TaxID=706552 RepID=A0AAW1PL28_9CHLO